MANLPLHSRFGNGRVSGNAASRPADQEMKDSLRQVDVAISASASAEIERIHAASGMSRADYVPALLKSYLADHLSQDVKLQNPLEPTYQELADLAKELAPRDPSKQPFEWVVGLYERHRVESEDLFNVSGIAFALFPGVLHESLGKELDYDEGTKRWSLVDNPSPSRTPKRSSGRRY